MTRTDDRVPMTKADFVILTTAMNRVLRRLRERSVPRRYRGGFPSAPASDDAVRTAQKLVNQLRRLRPRV